MWSLPGPVQGPGETKYHPPVWPLTSLISNTASPGLSRHKLQETGERRDLKPSVSHRNIFSQYLVPGQRSVCCDRAVEDESGWEIKINEDIRKQ